MLLSHNLLKGLKLNLYLLQIIGTYPLRLTRDSNGSLEFSSCNKLNIKWQWFKIGVSVGFCCIFWIQLFQGRATEGLPTTLETLLYASGSTVCTIMSAAYLHRNDAVVELLTCFLNFEKHQSQIAPTFSLSKRGKLLVNFIQFSGFVCSPVILSCYVIQRWMNPCTSATFGWNLLMECFDEEFKHIGNKLSRKSLIYLTGCLLFTYWVALDLLGKFAFQVAEMFYLPSVCLIGYVRDRTRWNSLPYAIRKYRELQLLTRFYNWIQQDTVIVTMLNFSLLIIIISLYVMISLGSSISIPHLVLFSCALTDGLLTAVVCFGSCANVHSQSEKMLEFIKKKTSFEGLLSCRKQCESRIIKRCVTSMFPLNIRIGDVNFVEKLTPIVVLDFCFGLIVNLLLID